MKIIFFCGSLEPGRNGVGDYTRVLAKELILLGYEVLIVSLYDSQVDSFFCGAQADDGVEISVVRIPSAFTASDRISIVRSYIVQFNPNWISLQFVPFSFHPKGLPFGLYKLLAKIGSGYKWHIMFHELWVVKEPGTNWKRSIYSKIQKLLIEKLIKELKPKLIHTHLPSYKKKIEDLGYRVSQLPLFSNIRVTDYANNLDSKSILRVGMFSQVDARPEIVDYIAELSNQANKIGCFLEILLIGGSKKTMNSIASQFSKIDGFKGKVVCTGFLDARDVSLSLQSCTLGLTPVPRQFLGKSGSVAAFLSHGIPVAAPVYLTEQDKNNIGFFYDNFKSAIMLSASINDISYSKSNALELKDKLNPSLIALLFDRDLVS